MKNYEGKLYSMNSNYAVCVIEEPDDSGLVTAAGEPYITGRGVLCYWDNIDAAWHPIQGCTGPVGQTWLDSHPCVASDTAVNVDDDAAPSGDPAQVSEWLDMISEWAPGLDEVLGDC